MDPRSLGDSNSLRIDRLERSPGTGIQVPVRKLRPPLSLGLRRERLIGPFVEEPAGIWVVQGFAGCGKTTALAHASQAWPGKVLWVTADGTDRVGNRFVGTLAQAAGVAEDVGPALTDQLFAVIDVLDASPEPVLVALDDAHELAGTPAVDALGLLCRYRPLHVTVALGVRHLHGLGHWRWSAGQPLRELDSDSLRFRLWEVEALFRDCYGSPHNTAEVHAVSRLTDGWAVALHLYHIATRKLSAPERRRLLAGPRLTVRSIRDYLADQVLATVTPQQRSLLRRVAVFDSIRTARCEELLAMDGRLDDQLQQLADLGLLLPDADGVTFRLHDLLRAQLLGELDHELGHGGVAGLHRLAADVLEAEGDLTEAVRACGRGGDWDGVRRLLACDDGPHALTGDWADEVPALLRDTDPWVLRAIARRQMGEGDLAGARASLAASVERSQQHGGDSRTMRQLHVLDGWLDPDPGQQRTWTECLRKALAAPVGGKVGTPFAWPDDACGLLGEGLAALASGQVSRAIELLDRAGLELRDELGLVADIALCLAKSFAIGSSTKAHRNERLMAERVLVRARAQGAPALLALAELLAAFVARERLAPDVSVALARERGDVVGEGLHWLLGGLAGFHADPDAVSHLLRAADCFRAQSLAVLASFASGAATLAGVMRQVDKPDDGDGHLHRGPTTAEGGPLPHALALLTTALRHQDAQAEQAARALASQHGFSGLLTRLAPPASWSVAAGSGAVVVADAVAPVTGRSVTQLDVRCLGDLGVTADGAELAIDRLRPQHQELLGVFATHPGTWLHREKLMDWMWRDTDPDRATRSLQVAVSAVRRLLEPGSPAGHPHILVRSGERYRLDVQPECSDVGRLEGALERARQAVRDDDPETAASAFDAALSEWAGEPVASLGPLDWAVERRRELAHAVGSAAEKVVTALRCAGAIDVAAALASRAVEIHRQDDQLWQLAVASADDAGATVLATDLRRRYRQLVAM